MSFKDAFAGFKKAYISQPNFRVQTIIAVAVVLISFILPLNNFKQGVIIFIATEVLSFELLNTALERLSDVVSPNLRPQIKTAKDTAAASVLFAAFGALIAGLLIVFGH